MLIEITSRHFIIFGEQDQDSTGQSGSVGECLGVELETKVHTKAHNHGEGPLLDISPGRHEIGTQTQLS